MQAVLCGALHWLQGMLLPAYESCDAARVIHPGTGPPGCTACAVMHCDTLSTLQIRTLLSAYELAILAWEEGNTEEVEHVCKSTSVCQCSWLHVPYSTDLILAHMHTDTNPYLSKAPRN